MIKKSWLLLIPLVSSLLWVGAAPTHAAGETWSITGVNAFGCQDGGWTVATVASGLDSDPYVFHAVVTSAGKTYSNEFIEIPGANGAETWQLGSSFNYGAVSSPGTYPIVPGVQMKAVFTLERPKGTVLSSWTMVAASCDSASLVYNGSSAGLPVRERTLTLKARYGPKRVVGKLYAPGFPELYAGRRVQIWKKRPGPDRLVATRTTTSAGKFKARVHKGRYYATSPDFIAAASGEALADISNRVRLR